VLGKMQVQNDYARFRLVGRRTLPIHEIDGLLAIAEYFEKVALFVLIQSVPQQKHVGGIVFHHYNLRGSRIFDAQFKPPCGNIEYTQDDILTLDAKASVTVTRQ
jgi:hypothetical protein